MWPTGLPAVGVDLKGRIPAGEQASLGRALGRLSDIGWGNRLRPLLAPQAPDGPVPDDVAKAVVGVLADWAKGPGGWSSGQPDAQPRPVGVVTVASRSRPQLIRSLGAGIAEIGRLPLLGSVEYVGDGTHISRSNSAQRLKALDGALSVSPELAAALKEAEGPILLVDDATETGWTLAVAARMLRRAGAQGCCRWSSPCRRDPRVPGLNTGQVYRRPIGRKRPVAPIARCRNPVRQEELESAPRSVLPWSGRALLRRAHPPSPTPPAVWARSRREDRDLRIRSVLGGSHVDVCRPVCRFHQPTGPHARTRRMGLGRNSAAAQSP